MIAGLLALALAQDPASPPPDPDEAYEVVVWGAAALRQGRSELVREFREAGWKKRREANGQIVFKPPEPWMGRAVLHYDGTLQFRRPVLALKSARAANPVEYGPNPHMDRDPGGLNYGDDGYALPHPEGSFWFLPSRSVLDPAEQSLRQRVEPTLQRYRDVVEATSVRAPDELR